jgi:hypothetical protein
MRTSLANIYCRSTILFDGALPVSKRAERVSRTEQNNRRVQQLRANYATTACPIPTYLGASSYAFLAPSLREALAGSPFGSRTRIVAGEADDSCALHAKETTRAIIFTSDTDFLLYDYQPDTLIVFFQDADLSAGVKAHAPDRIRQELKLQSLTPFAYAVQQRSSESLNDLVLDARNTDINSVLYLDFSRRYTAVLVSPGYMEKDHILSSPLQALDVRAAEFVHQVLSDSTNPVVYLPLLIEDPNQASAWNVAQDIRTLAYSLLAPPSFLLREYRRKAQGIFPQNISPYSAANVEVPTKQLEAQLSALLKWAEPKDLKPPLVWSLFAISLVLAELNTPPPSSLVMRVINGDFDNTWAFFQLIARVQAAVYSLRMLKQILAVRLAIDQQTDPNFHDSLMSLHMQLASFPSIAAMFIITGQAKRVLADNEQLRGLVEEIYQSAGVEMHNEQTSSRKKKKQAREAERKKRKMEQRQQSQTHGSNAFALLNNGGQA